MTVVRLQNSLRSLMSIDHGDSLSDKLMSGADDLLGRERNCFTLLRYEKTIKGDSRCRD